MKFNLIIYTKHILNSYQIEKREENIIMKTISNEKEKLPTFNERKEYVQLKGRNYIKKITAIDIYLKKRQALHNYYIEFDLINQISQYNKKTVKRSSKFSLSLSLSI